MTPQKGSVLVQYRHNHHRANYIVHVSNSVIFFLNIFSPWLIESVYGRPVDMKGNYSVVQREVF